MVIYNSGDILTSGADLIVHQVNCQGVMGKGLAEDIKKEFPDVFEKYKALCDAKNDLDLLGHTLIVEGKTGPKPIYIANLFAQRFYGQGRRFTDYKALWNCLNTLDNESNTHIVDGAHGFFTTSFRTIAIPYGMGCGLGGGDWVIVSSLIRAIFEDSNYHVQIWKLDKPRF
jgi:O-acetyl-ADP-ribose deacetylase (regulator of RNase III)